MTRKDYGIHVTGRVDSVTELQHRSGTSAKGSAYSFYQQVATLALGGEMVEVVFRADANPGGPLCHYELDDVIRVKVHNPRIFGGRVSFDAMG